MSSQPTLLSTCRRSALPIAYQMHASQWAISANVAISSSRTAAPYSEYRSIFLATRTSRSNLAVFNSPMSVVVWNYTKQTGRRTLLSGRGSPIARFPVTRSVSRGKLIVRDRDRRRFISDVIRRPRIHF
jgi:hypothetical protein